MHAVCSVHCVECVECPLCAACTVHRNPTPLTALLHLLHSMCKQFHRQCDNSFMFAMDQLHCMQFKNILSSKEIISGWASYVHCWKYNRDSFRCCRQFLCATDWFVGYWRQFCEFAAQFVILIMASLCPCPQRVIGGRQGHKGNALKPCNAQCHSTRPKKRSRKEVRIQYGSRWSTDLVVLSQPDLI